ncbi:hypothetical protein FF38_07162 [Lucilia cuprina]|uniref:Uncharacterized protein n=1 Tax=Lucilia cuprina TaxID=7375 RepID=A0A0L0CLD4_LUCCU|nr:hypothetical protein FF38_07162 [Lucilia cuprina]
MFVTHNNIGPIPTLKVHPICVVVKRQQWSEIRQQWSEIREVLKQSARILNQQFRSLDDYDDVIDANHDDKLKLLVSLSSVKKRFTSSLSILSSTTLSSSKLVIIVHYIKHIKSWGLNSTEALKLIKCYCSNRECARICFDDVLPSYRNNLLITTEFKSIDY